MEIEKYILKQQLCISFLQQARKVIIYSFSKYLLSTFLYGRIRCLECHGEPAGVLCHGALTKVGSGAKRTWRGLWVSFVFWTNFNIQIKMMIYTWNSIPVYRVTKEVAMFWNYMIIVTVAILPMKYVKRMILFSFGHENTDIQYSHMKMLS